MDGFNLPISYRNEEEVTCMCEIYTGQNSYYSEMTILLCYRVIIY